MVTILYTEGNGFTRIARILSKIFNRKFCYQLIIKWIKKMHKILLFKKEPDKIYNECKILEMNELCTYVKKNLKMVKKQSKFGLPMCALKK